MSLHCLVSQVVEDKRLLELEVLFVFGSDLQGVPEVFIHSRLCLLVPQPRLSLGQ